MNPLLISIIILGLAVILLVVWIFILEKRISALLGGKSGASLEDAISANREGLQDLMLFKSAVETELNRINDRIKKKLHGAKTLRFNPFHGTGSGGNQSFATAFLDEQGDGVVISSLYSREKVSVFAKPIKNRTSEFDLTDEEKEVLK